MNRLVSIFIFFFFIACSSQKGLTTASENNRFPTENISSEQYELMKPEKQEGLLILFPCFPCNAENTRIEFDILEAAREHNVAVLLMNFNRHLWLSEAEKKEIEKTLIQATKAHELNTENTFIGGFSSGGNVALLITDYLTSANSPIQPKGVFIADSPIDLLGLYKTSKRNVLNNFSAPAVQEGNWIIGLFDAEFGKGDTSLVNYENKSPYFSKTHSTKNLSHLKGVKIRLYSEPDTVWWKENRQTDYEDMNAYYIEQLAADLRKLYGESAVDYIQTKNKGYRANGDRHPHSWSIIDKHDLIQWMTVK